MSKRKQTENLHLYAYELTTGLPTFLKDWSDNMAILDGAHASVLSLISALDVRITTAEGTLEDLSPESIQDYKIRLNALEKKVVINTNSIKDVNTKIATVNAQINTINAEQIVQNNRLTAIETLGASHTELINELRTDLTGIDGRVTTLEQCCENVQHEIADMQHDIDGFNDDVTALATQVETLSTTVSELTELVNSLQLDVVSQRLDSFEASLTALTVRVATAESNITAQDATLEEHNTRITANANNIEDIDGELGDTDYSEIGDTVSSSLVELANRIRALTPQEYDALVSRLNTVETEVGDIEDAVDNLDSNVSDLQTSVASKASASDVALLQGDVSTLRSDVSTLSTVVGNSLDVTDPDEGAGVIKFGVDANGNYGYKKVGADTVTPFKGDIVPVNFPLTYSQTTSITGWSTRQSSTFTTASSFALEANKKYKMVISYRGNPRPTPLNIKDSNNNIIADTFTLILSPKNSSSLFCYEFTPLIDVNDILTLNYDTNSMPALDGIIIMN